PPGWAPDVAAARAYAAQRPGTVSFAVRTERRAWGHRPTRGVPAASTLKAMLLVAYLRRPEVRRRALTRRDRSLLAPMIRRSDNVAATRVRDVLGPRLARFARRAGVRRFEPHPVWGLSRVDAAGLATFMLDVDRLTPRRHRPYAMNLLSTIVPRQRWGIARATPHSWRLYFKGGWGSGTGRVDHQVALLTRRDERLSLAITTTDNGSHAAGKRTLRGVAKRLLRGL
ncbi:MAG TPA: serine hydrolase, partial [Solirubrobacteraceae bacterium]|nr:serine hydrolase [Solirubrobacteraceae bacterium]